MRGFWSLIVTQFQGAFSDLTYRNLLLFLIIGLERSPEQQKFLVFLVGLLFSLPFVLFSMSGGWLADRFSKRSVTIGTKLMEVAVMALALVALTRGYWPLAITALFLMATQSALFGPSKYGLLPELLPEKRLSWGNGVIELATFLAIIAGTVAGGVLAENFRSEQHWSGVILVALAFVGLLTSLGISRVPAAAPAKRFRANFLADLLGQVRLIRADYVLFLAVLGNTYFWFLGSLLQFNTIFYGTEVLGLSESRTGYLMGALAIGIGLGSLAAGYLSGNKIEYGLVPLGALGMSVFAVLLGRTELSFTAAGANLAGLGFFAGFFIVPVNALIQHRPAPEQKGSIIAAANLLSFVGVGLASAIYWLLTAKLKLAPQPLFLTSAAVTLASTAYALWLLPDSLLRLVLWLATHTFYRLRVEGRDNIPERGGALFVVNHVSLIDAFFVGASTDRIIRFLMDKDYYERPYIRPWARLLKIIPVSSTQRPRELLRSLREATEAIKAGEVVGIFAEGQITRIGQMLPFRRGFERIMKGLDAPIVPVNLDGAWGSIFSFEKGRFLWKRPRRVPYPVTVSYGKPLPATATAAELRRAVQELGTEAFHHRRRWMLPLGRAFIRGGRRFPFRFAMADQRVERLRFGSALTRAVFLARRLMLLWRGQEMVGILMPPSVPGALVNFAALLSGKIPVNLNYTASEAVIASCAAQCELKTIVTSSAFLERVKLQLPGQVILLEELAAKPGFGERLAAFLLAWTLPATLLQKALGAERQPTLDDLATVIFSSGSTGDPKGVMLTHYNIAANVEQMDQVFRLTPDDRLLGILPFFHSFGFTVTLALPAVLGIGVVYHASPLDAAAVSELTRRYGVTFLMATPTFLGLYIRRCAPEDFGSLACVLAGAEKLPERLAQSFEDRFGLRPLEGYGCTECAPVVAVNRPDFRAAGFRQVGAKRGKIGHPLPGVSVRIADVETMQPVELGQTGMLLVRGPNVMQGYLGQPEKTAEVLRDGWYVTGDVAALDEDGFLQITDRLSRFSKIGGEMVPHIKVEEKLHELAEATEQTFVVTGVPDARKGERLVVLHRLAEPELAALLQKLPQTDLPNLWVPRPNQFFRVESFPLLGTGKLDLRRIRDLALGLSPQVDA